MPIGAAIPVDTVQYLICKLLDSKFMDGVYTSFLGMLHVLLKSLLMVFNIK